MPQPRLSLPASELERLEQCVREPIGTPGRIQSHGILFAWNRVTARIDTVSENARAWLGHTMEDLAIPELEWSVMSGANADPKHIELYGIGYDVVVHELGDRVIVELESDPPHDKFASTSVIAAMRRLGRAESAEQLRQQASEEIRSITGFDRVMVYRFFDDGHGEVAAESAAPEMEPYAGLRFPASDIPQQARSLYLIKLSRVIAGTSDRGLALLSSDAGGEPLDLSCAELRAVSPHHLQFMRNMGQESTVSFSLVHDGRLIGMITCAHRTPYRIPVLLRRALEVLVNQLTTQLVSLESIARLRRQLDVREKRTQLLAPVAGASDPLHAVLTGPLDLLDLVPADGAIVMLDGISKSTGTVPRAERTALLAAAGTEPFVTDALSVTHPALSALMPDVAGLVVAPIPGHGVALFFRHEVTQVVRWLGDQSDANRDSPLSPRRSFSEWRESVEGTSLPWGPVADEARLFGEELADALDRRAESQLAELAMVDSLTGLGNRRAIRDVLETAVAEGRSGGVMFLDLDRFKSINDEHGHEAGDVVLRTVSQRLVSSVRSSDEVARLGGDEFVVFSPDLPASEHTSFAQRLVDALAEPIDLAPGTTVVVTASCGVTQIDAHHTPRAILDAADAAMYRAKTEGRNRASI